MMNDLASPDALNTWGLWCDVDGAPLPTSYSRLREGIERFFITDINNPAAGSRAQSMIAVMWDSWGAAVDDPNTPIATGGIASFNHVPGGCNVLYMDGHVQFVRYNAGYPVETPIAPFHSTSWGGNRWEHSGMLAYWMPIYGGFQ